MIKLLKKVHFSFQLPVKISFLLCLYMLCTSVPSPFKLYDSFSEFLWQIFARIILLIILMIMLCLPTYLVCRFIFRKNYAKFSVKKKTALYQLKSQSKTKNKLSLILRNLLHNFISNILMMFYIQPDYETDIEDKLPSLNDNKTIPAKNESDEFEQQTSSSNSEQLTNVYTQQFRESNYKTSFDNTLQSQSDNRTIPTKNEQKKTKQAMTDSELLQFAIACNQQLHKEDMQEWNSQPSFNTIYTPNSTYDFLVIDKNNPITDFDSMTGSEFEEFCADILTKNAFTNVEITKGSHDQGVDILAEKDDIKYAIQCKCYSSNIGNAAVQEAFAGKVFYNCHVAVVLTNRYFTNDAQMLAIKNGVLLWDRNKLLKLIIQTSHFNKCICILKIQ